MEESLQTLLKTTVWGFANRDKRSREIICSHTYLVAKGFDETCGNDKNSSLSIVPLLSCHTNQISLLLFTLHPGRQLVMPHTLSNFMNLFRNLSTSSLSTV